MLADAHLGAFVATSQPDVARAFYRDTLGLTLVEDGPFALVFDGGGTVLRVQKVQQVVAPPYTSIGWRVADIEATVQALTDKGVVFARYPGMPQDALGIWDAPGGAKVAWFKDPDGHTLSLAWQG
ncbi:MAG: VOC family protein [Alphaproteobacteria bacterium]|nr:VOC family protein [Alphaproteobacteria bacterium]